MKKVINVSALMIFLVICTLICGCNDRAALDEDLHNVIQVKTDDSNDPQYIMYQGVRYNYDKYGLFDSIVPHFNPKKNDKLVGWNGFRDGYIDSYYLKESDPIFIYELRLRNAFLRDDYDYKSDTFRIQGTKEQFIFSNSFVDTDTDMDIDRLDTIKIVLKSESHPQLKIYLDIYCEDDGWYACSEKQFEKIIFALSDEFVNILYKNEII